MRLVGGYAACSRCGGGLPGDVHDDLVCRCGTGNQQRVMDWQHIGTMLTIRSAGRCEIRSPECLAARWNGALAGLSSQDTSIHHRRPRGMGGTRRVDVHSLAALINTCGTGSRGCHWYAEQNRVWAEGRGLLVPNIGAGAAVDVTQVPLVLHSGRRVLLDIHAPYYLPAPGLPYAV